MMISHTLKQSIGRAGKGTLPHTVRGRAVLRIGFLIYLLFACAGCAGGGGGGVWGGC
ncbi:hypothetical protein M430DRAFT_32403 [Amorphotheca resinae ATCC 22711]|jgi:hypothetical protein|uniref:Uncharacterized protein n=1 Tax=Amorphotheca resinae ATCC 22711 TaxID=857342 RepID=A0A2T3BEM0_AMORE|nr:hypothetical protein M430DRAFT_32403 [Amorphotheca resinae ATCC 22711]PSS27822.1 hypothetical protein M430DRAFT_32403 [Amorphotheca resinae ATCC 22711]